MTRRESFTGPARAGRPRLLGLLLLLLPCAPAPAQEVATPPALFRAWQEQHLTSLAPSEVRHEQLKGYLAQLRAAGIPVKEVGRSLAGREIYQMEFGRGPLKVFMWSQMHGDEPTATSALMDLFYFLQRHRETPWVAAIEKSLTIRAVPMLNPDGAELFQRRNLQSIDINRDARALATPEGRLLKKLRDEWAPEIGFNLHNQNPRTTVGDTGRQATISLLAVPADASGSETPGRVRNKRLCAVMIEALSPFIYGHIARYDDTFNPRAFGDMISQWGTPVILVETGALQGKSELDLVQLNFVAYAAALHALASGAVERANPALYDALRFNTNDLIYDLIVRGATVVYRPRRGERATPPYKADIAVNENIARGGPARRASLRDVGDLSIFRGLEEIDAAGYYILLTGRLNENDEGAPALLFYREERAGEGVDWNAPDLETRLPPDATYRDGQWSGPGSQLLRKKR